MKKSVSLLIALLMLFGMMSVPAMAADEVSVYLFGQKLSFDVPAQIIDGRTMVPMRGIFEALGATVDWDGETRTVTSVRGDKIINLTIDSYVMFVNGKAISLDVAPCIVKGRTLVPARAVSESFGLDVDWDGETKSVLITDGSGSEAYTTVFDSMKNAIMQYGAYDSGMNEYWLTLSEYDMVFSYMPEDDAIALAWIDETSFENMDIAVIVGFYKEYYSDGYIGLSSLDGSEMYMMVEFDGPGFTMGEVYGDYDKDYESELLEAMLYVIEYGIEPAIYETFGFTLWDIDINLD